MIEALGRLPREGEVVQHDGRALDVTGVGEARIDELRAQPVREGEEGGQAARASAASGHQGDQAGS